MNHRTAPKAPASTRFIRGGAFWLLAIEGALLGALYLAGLGYGLITGNELLTQLWKHNPVFLIAFCLLLVASLVATARRVYQRRWSRLPGLLLAWITVGGGLAQTFFAFLPAPLSTPYRLITALAALALVLYFAVYLREQATVAVSTDPGEVTAGRSGIPRAGSAEVCGRCGEPNPHHLVSLQDGSQPTRLCDGCYREVIRPNTAFQQQKRG